MKIVQIKASEVWSYLFEDYAINMIDSDNVVYFLNGYNVDQVTTWIHEVMENRMNAAFFYLVTDYAAE